MHYQAVDFLTKWIGYLLIVMPFAAGAVVTYQATRRSLTSDEDELSDAKKKIVQTIKGAILIESIGGFITVVKSFYM